MFSTVKPSLSFFWTNTNELCQASNTCRYLAIYRCSVRARSLLWRKMERMELLSALPERRLTGLAKVPGHVDSSRRGSGLYTCHFESAHIGWASVRECDAPALALRFVDSANSADCESLVAWPRCRYFLPSTGFSNRRARCRSSRRRLCDQPLPHDCRSVHRHRRHTCRRRRTNRYLRLISEEGSWCFKYY